MAAPHTKRITAAEAEVNMYKKPYLVPVPGTRVPALGDLADGKPVLRAVGYKIDAEGGAKGKATMNKVGVSCRHHGRATEFTYAPPPPPVLDADTLQHLIDVYGTRVPKPKADGKEWERRLPDWIEQRSVKVVATGQMFPPTSGTVRMTIRDEREQLGVATALLGMVQLFLHTAAPKSDGYVPAYVPPHVDAALRAAPRGRFPADHKTPESQRVLARARAWAELFEVFILTRRQPPDFDPEFPRLLVYDAGYDPDKIIAEAVAAVQDAEKAEAAKAANAAALASAFGAPGAAEVSGVDDDNMDTVAGAVSASLGSDAVVFTVKSTKLAEAKARLAKLEAVLKPAPACRRTCPSWRF
jgi:hypothetical protein